MDVRIGYFNLSIIGSDIFIVNKLIKNHRPNSEIIITGLSFVLFNNTVKYILSIIQKRI